MKFEKTEVWGFEHAIRGMRNPLESWHKSDSGNCDWSKVKGFECDKHCLMYNGSGCKYKDFIIGENDLELMQKLIRAGSEHRKFMRQIFVSVDITAPLFWWKEADQYKVGTTTNSTSTMHKLASTPITMDCFEMVDFAKLIDNYSCKWIWENLIVQLEDLRQRYNETKDKRYWKELIRLLPESWLQTRTVTLNYENLLSIVKQRKNHKLTEWSIEFMIWVKTLPYAEELLFLGE